MIYATPGSFLWFFICLLLAGCGASEQAERSAQSPLFTLLPPQQTRIKFANTLSEHPGPQRNRLLYEYFSNGGGVAIGDLNGDGLDEIYFSGNMSYNALYLNRGHLVFEDITFIAGVAGRKNTWKTGVTMADVNGDGRLDIYVCYSGDLPLDRRVDALYINLGNDSNGVPQFEDQAAAFGLANPHSSNQAYFFDYDRDGDLDLFLLNHNVKNIPRMDEAGTRAQLEIEDPISGVRLYRNDAGQFEDVTRSAGLQSSSLSYGLGAGVADLNQDGWADLYIGNDYAPPDFLYINNGDGTFTDELGDRIGQTSNAAMGVDVADINNDGWPEIVVLDMLPERVQRQKTQFIPDDREEFGKIVKSGFHHQYMRNTLQLNNRNGTFSEIGRLAGISSTDWSWAPLFADFDNDGRKDLFISNGNLYDTLDRDFLAFKRNYIASKQQALTPGDIAYLMSLLPKSDVNNFVFKGQDGYQFQDVSSSWGLGEPLRSAGAAYADLDNDGDLDLVTNNINTRAAVFENHASERSGRNYLQLDLEGDGLNTAGIGAKVMLYAGGGMQYLEQMPTRGYLSSVGPTLHFGLGTLNNVDSLRIIWADGGTQVLKSIQANQRLNLFQKDATLEERRPGESAPWFKEIPSPISFTHQMAGQIDDFNRQPLLDHPQSFSGPAMAAADVNGDDLEDVFVGGGNGQASRLFLQQKDGRFTRVSSQIFSADAASYDADAVFLDYNGDGYDDLYVASGGYGDFDAEDARLQDRLYRNDGNGAFTLVSDALPEMLMSTGAVSTHDINGDELPDLFVGGYVVPGRYPEPPRSYILINDGQGHFEDRTSEMAPDLVQPGMIRDAVWEDLDGDGIKELIIAGIWKPIRVFDHDNGKLTDETHRFFKELYTGLWQSLLVEDLNGDGVMDLVAGNLGLNSTIKASVAQPAVMYYGDFNNDGSIDPLFTYNHKSSSELYPTLDELRLQMPAIASQFSSYADYSRAKISDLFRDGRLEEAGKLEVHHLETSLFLGTKAGYFEKRQLPEEAQFSPVHVLKTVDYNRDGILDLIMAGNTNDAQIRIGKYDASYGTLLKGMGDGAFTYIDPSESGLRLKGAVRGMVTLDRTLLFGTNQSGIQGYHIKE